MTTPLLVVTPSPAFGEMIRKSLEDTESYRVFIANNKASAIVRADEELCRLAFLDMDLGEQWVEEVGAALRTVIPNIKLFILVGDETPPAFDSLRPWNLLRKPFHVPEVLTTLARPAEPIGNLTPEPEAPILPWLDDVNKAAQHLTRLTLESASQAALITRDSEVWAYAGQLSQAAAQEVAATMARHWEADMDGDLLRFARFEATKAEHILYATRIAPGMLLGLVFDAETPFSTIRSQAIQLGTSFAESETPPAVLTSAAEPRLVPAPPPEPVVSRAAAEPLQWPRGSVMETPQPAAEAMEEEEDEIPLPPIADILQDIPAPDPQLFPSASSMEKSRPADPGETRRSIFARDYETPLRSSDVMDPGAETIASRPAPTPPSEAARQAMPAAQPSRPETPVRKPLPGEMEATMPHSMVGFSRSGAGEPVVLEPASAGLYHLTYACLLVPRFTSHYLTGDVADKLSEWMPIICVAYGWRLEYLAVRPDYLQWVVNVPPATSPGYVMRVMREQTSEKVFTAFPRLKRDNPSGDFWAPGYLIMGGTQPHPSQLVKDYIRQVRQRQGVEKPKK
jgi:REP element-mobilizing transposase RayT